MDNNKYIRLPYIKNITLDAYIKIPISFNQDNYINYTTYIIDSSNRAIMGAKNSNSEEIIIETSQYWYDNNTKVNFGYTVDLGKHNFLVSGKGYVKIDNKEIAKEDTSKPNWSIDYIGIGMNVGNYNCIQRFIGMKTYNSLDDYNNEKISHNFIPCKRIEDNVLGVYDLVDEVFYPSTKGKWTTPFNFNNVTSIQIPEGNVVKLQDKDGKVLWTNINKLAYGIRWSTNTGTTCERIGNLDFHRTLPIQSKFRCCVHQGTDIKYYLNPDDSRFKENPIILTKDNITFDSCDGLPDGITCCDEDAEVKYCCTNDIFADYKYLYSYLAIKHEDDVCIARIVYIDTATKTAYINDKNQVDSKYVSNTITLDNIVAADYSVELGASLNGYDGELGVDTGGKFYQWSVDNAGDGNEVWISEYKCVSYAKEVKRHIIGCSRACVLNTAFNNSKWGWIGTLQANTSVNVVNYDYRLRGGSNNSQWDKYLGSDNFRCQFNKGRTNMQLSVMRQYTQKLANHQVLYKQLWEAIVWCWCIEYAQLDVKKAYNAALTTDGYHQGGLGNGYSVNGIDLANYNNNECFTPCDYTLHLGNNTGIRTRAKRNWNIIVAANHYWNYYNYSRVTATRDSTNKILTITKIATAYPNDWNIYAGGTSISGIHKYTISGLTDSQSIIFKTRSGNITVTEDGTYEIDWSDNNANRLIAFSKAQTECNIVITIEEAPSAEIVQSQNAWDVPHWRGFNVFWYGDIWLNIENFLSKYDGTKGRRIYYWTDDVTKFDNTIDNKEHQLEDIVAPQSNWVNEFNLGNQGSLTPRSYGNAKNVYHWNNADASIHTTFAGGRVGHGSCCGLACLVSSDSVSWARAYYGFATCTIID